MAKKKADTVIENPVAETVSETVSETPTKETTLTETVTETETPAVEAPSNEALFIEIPAKVCVQIGLRKRYFDTKEEALEALNAFNAKGEAKTSGARRVFLTAEQKAEVLARRAPLMAFAQLQGKEGKLAAMLANTLEDIIAAVPGVFDLIKEYVEAQPATEEVPAEEAPEVQEGAEIEAAGSDPLADFI